MIFNAPNSAASGGTLTVTAPTGVTVTLTKDGKTKTKTANADGMAIFKGLASGKWNVTIVNSDGKPTTITADVQTEYTVTIAFFSATINITYPSGSTCTATDGTTTLTAPDTSGTWACVVPNAGTWTVAATDGDKTKSDTVAISANGQSESITLQYITYLFKDGDTFDALTGGWNGTVDETTQALRLSVAAGNTAAAYTKSKVDVTDHDTISFDVTASMRVSLILADKLAGTQYASVTMSANATHADLDISNLTGSYIVWLSFYSERGGTAYVSEVSLT